VASPSGEKLKVESEKLKARDGKHVSWQLRRPSVFARVSPDFSQFSLLFIPDIRLCRQGGEYLAERQKLKAESEKSKAED